MGAIDIAIVGPALPAITAEFGLDSRSASWIFTGYVLANLIGTPLMAKLGLLRRAESTERPQAVAESPTSAIQTQLAW